MNERVPYAQTLAQALARMRPQWAAFAELPSRIILRGDVLDIVRDGASLPVRHLLDWISSRGHNGVIDGYLHGCLAVEGPRVFQPTWQQCQAMENVEVRLDINDYRQSFPTLVIEFPRRYRDERQTQIAIDGHPLGQDPVADPVYVVVRHEQALRMILIAVQWSIGISTVEILRQTTDMQSIEEMLCAFTTANVADARVLPTEQIATRLVSRVAINACLLLADYGGYIAGYANPEHAERLVRRSREARRCKDADRAARNEQELATMPQLLALPHTVRLHDERSTPTECSTAADTASSVAPHWRRGHWRMQPYGPANSLRKRMFVRPVWVNAHLAASGSATSGQMGTIYVPPVEVEPWPCEVCGTVIDRPYRGQLYCGPACSTAAARRRKHGSDEQQINAAAQILGGLGVQQ